MAAGIKMPSIWEQRGGGGRLEGKIEGKGEVRGEGGGENCWRRTGTGEEERLEHLQM